jgi:hypothetical protein
MIIGNVSVLFNFVARFLPLSALCYSGDVVLWGGSSCFANVEGVRNRY